MLTSFLTAINPFRILNEILERMKQLAEEIEKLDASVKALVETEASLVDAFTAANASKDATIIDLVNRLANAGQGLTQEEADKIDADRATVDGVVAAMVAAREAVSAESPPVVSGKHKK